MTGKAIEVVDSPSNDQTYFDLLVRQSEVLARSSILPGAYRGKGADIIAAGLAGRAFGWDVMTSINNYHVIEGKASMRPEAMLGLVRKLGHSVSISLFDDAGIRVAEAKGIRADNHDEHTARFTAADARAAGLWDKKNWKQYQDAMLQWRAVSALCRFLFPDVVLGVGYVPEEMGASTEVYEDPLADARVVSIDAKRMLLERCLGDKEMARSIWGSRTGDTIPQTEVEELLAEADRQIAEATDEPEIEDAVVVEPDDKVVVLTQRSAVVTSRAKLGSAAKSSQEETVNE